MAEIDEMNQWCKDARKLLSSLESEGPKALGKNTEAVAALLKKMEPQKALYPDYGGYLAEYELLASSAQTVNRDVSRKKLTASKGRDEVKAISVALRRLSQRMDLAMGARAPTATAEQRKAVVDAARHKPVYDDKCKRIQAAIDELKELPGTRKQVKALDDLLTLAAGYEPEYDAAYKKLAGLSKNLEAGRKAAASFAKEGGGKEFQKTLAALRKAIGDYDAVAGMGDSGRVQAERKNIDVQLGKLETALDATPPGAVEPIRQTLETHATKLDNDRSALLVDQEKVGAHQTTLTPLMVSLRNFGTQAVIGPMLQSYNAAQALAGSQQYKAAREAFDLLAPRLTTAAQTAESARTAWLATDAKLEKGLATLASAAELSSSKYPALTSVASQLATRIRGELRIGLAGARDFAGASAVVTNDHVLEDIETIGKMVEKAAAGQEVKPVFAGARALLMTAIDTAGAPLRAQRQRLDEELQKLEAAGGLAAPFRARAADIVRQWGEATGPITDDSREATAEQRIREAGALAPKAQGLTASIKKIADEVVAAQVPGSPELEKSKAAKAQNEKKPEYERLRNLAFKNLEYLSEFGVPDSHTILATQPAFTGLKETFATLETEAGKGVYETGKMDKLAGDAASKRGFIEVSLKSRRETSAKTVAELKTAIATLRKSKSAYAAFYDSLSDRLAEVSGMALSTVITLMEQGETQLANFKIEIDAQVAGAGENNFAAVEKERVALKKRIEVKSLKEYRPARQAALLTELEDVFPTRSSGLSPKASLDMLMEMAGRIATEEEEATRAEERVKALKADIAELKKGLAALTDAPKLKADLTARIETADGMPKSQVAEAEVALKTVRVLLTAAKDNARRPAMENKLVSDAQVAALDKAAFDASVDVFAKNLQREAQEVYDGFGLVSLERNSELHGLIAKHLADAVKDGKTGNYVLAREKLRMAESSARTFMSNPYQPAVAARKALASSSSAWKNAVGGYLKSVVALKGAIQKANQSGTRTSDTDLAAALSALDPLNTLFNPLTFESAVVELHKSPKKPDEVKARLEAKEHALLLVQRMQRVITENRLIQVATDNPFQPVETGPLVQALKSLNGALLAS